MKPEDINNIIELYKGGKSFNTLGKLYGVSRSTISRLLQKHNVPIRSNYKDRHKHKLKPKYKSPYPRGKNPNSHKGRDKKPSPLYTHRQGQYKYKKRLPPRLCCFIKKNGEPCKAWAIAGAKICFHHGGRLIYKQAHGLNSKVLKRNLFHAIISHFKDNNNLMHFLTQLTPDEVKAVNDTDYSKLKILAAQHKLSDVLLTRSLSFLNELENKLKDLNAEIEKYNNGEDTSQTIQGLMITQATLMKNITATHTIISKHQETVGKLLTTQEQIINSGGLKASLNDLTLEVSKDSMSILLDLIESYKAAGAFKNLEELQTYLPKASAFDIVDYELLDD